MAFKAPNNWLGLNRLQKLVSHLSSDLCQIPRFDGTVERYIRCVLELPVVGYDLGESTFQFGVWVSISRPSWKAYRKGYANNKYEMESCFGYLAHEVPEFSSTLSLHAEIQFGHLGQRPMVRLHDRPDNSLVDAQTNGIQLSTIVKLFSRLHN
jgi:hypothetical protein